MDRAAAWSLLNEYTKSPSLIQHALAVEAAMRHYARLGGHDEELWGITGLVHDFDYERFPEPPHHTREGAKILRERAFPEEIVGCVLSHATWNQEEYPLDRPIRRTLFAVDELSGFIVAVALVRPEQLGGMQPSSVRKKLKQKSFAAGVSREDVEAGARLLGLELDAHVANCIAALQPAAAALGLRA